MKNYIQKFICKGFILMAGASMVLTGCKESFLEPDPQTMFKPSDCVGYLRSSVEEKLCE